MPAFTQSLRNTHSCCPVLDVKSVGQRVAPLRYSQSPRSCDSSPSDGQRWCYTGSAAARAFAFQGRCLCVANKPTRRTEQAGLYRPATTYGSAPVRVSNQPAGGNSRRHTQAPSSSGRALTQQMGLHGPHPHTPAPTTYRTCRPGLGKGTGTRYVRQRVTGSARHRGNCPSLALGPYSTDAGWRVETVNIPMSPCRRLDDTNYLNTGRKGEL
jgi:hypothetical protein